MNVPTAPNYGQGWSCIDDVTMPSQIVTGVLIVAQAVARRWGTPRGGLIDDPNYGFLIADYVSDDLGPGDLARIAQGASAEALKDERVRTFAASATLSASGTLTVTGFGTTARGPFKLVQSVSQLGVTDLQVTT